MGRVDVVWLWGTVVCGVPVDFLPDFVQAVELVEDVEGYGVVVFIVNG
jgi:hypothetical protein